jgi:hypothetical protein
MDDKRGELTLIQVGAMTPSLGAVTLLALGGPNVCDGFSPRVVRRSGNGRGTEKTEMDTLE